MNLLTNPYLLKESNMKLCSCQMLFQNPKTKNNHLPRSIHDKLSGDNVLIISHFG